MKKRPSRLALVGVLALALSVALSLAAGTAEAKKKKKKGGNSITLSKTTSTAIPAGDGTDEIAGVATLPFTVGKKAKGKVVSPSSLTATYQASDPAGGVDDLDLEIVAPSGRAVFLDNPAFLVGGAPFDTVVGPLTQTANSSTGYCAPNPAPPPAGCPNGNPDNSLAPPWAGTARNLDLALFSGVPARGTWLFKVLNFSTTSTHVLNLVSIHMNLVAAPK